MAKLSVVINAQNVEKDLPQALASVKDLADEIVVIDQGSTDGTAKIAEKFGAKIYKHEQVTHVELARNFAIGKATGDWILILDPDEEVGKDLALEIKRVIKVDKADYYRVPRKNIVFGKWLQYSRWWPDYNIRLFKKGKVSWNEVIHAVPMTLGDGADIDSEEKFAIVHNHYTSIEQYLERMNRYSSQQALEKVSGGYKFVWKDIVVKPIGEFLSRYFFGEGYKDGLHGLVVSLLQAFSELVIYLKVWQDGKYKDIPVSLGEINSLLRSQEKDLHYWQNDAVFKKTGKFTDRVKRKLRI